MRKKTFKNVVSLDEYEQQELNDKLFDLEIKFHKQVYYQRLDIFIKSLFRKYKLPSVQFDCKLEFMGLDTNEYEEIKKENLSHLVEGIEWKGTSDLFTMTTTTLSVDKAYLGSSGTPFITMIFTAKKWFENSQNIVITTTAEIKDYPTLFPNSYNEQEIENLLLKLIDNLNKIKYE